MQKEISLSIFDKLVMALGILGMTSFIGFIAIVFWSTEPSIGAEVRYSGFDTEFHEDIAFFCIAAFGLSVVAMAMTILGALGVLISNALGVSNFFIQRLKKNGPTTP